MNAPNVRNLSIAEITDYIPDSELYGASDYAQVTMQRQHKPEAIAGQPIAAGADPSAEHTDAKEPVQRYASDLILQSVITPHPNKERSKNGQYTLADALDIEATRERIVAAAAMPPEIYDAVRLTEANRVVRAVNDAMWYVSDEEVTARDRKRTVLDIDSIIDGQESNCYGYTLLASWCLEAIGIDHMIGYANGHSFLLLPTGDSERPGMWMVDPLTPEFSLNLDAITSGATLNEVQTQMNTYSRSAVYMDTNAMAEQLGYDFVSLAEKNPWLLRDNGRSHRAIGADPRIPARPSEKQTKLVLNILPMKGGRKALSATVGYRDALQNGEYEAALQHLLAMSGFVLDVDARNYKHTEIKSLVRNLCELRNLSGARLAIEAYFSSFRGNDDARTAIAKGDTQRMVAEMDPGEVPAVAESYREAMRSRIPSYVRRVIGPKLKSIGEEVVVV